MHASPPRAGVEPCTVAIAHRAGNDRALLLRAAEAGADWVEADIWWQRGELVARHERALWRLPLRYDEWRLGIAIRPALRLPQICDLLTGGPQLLIDFKGSARRLPAAVIACLRARDAVDRCAVCGQDWPALDEAVRLEPRLRAFYSLGTEQQLTALLRGSTGTREVRAVSCAEFLLTPPVLAELRDRRIAILAWTVNHRARAEELLSAGVYGITTDSPEVLALVKGFRQPLRSS
jgi:glycerophosphoryl diester phosphodiesterase